MAADRFEWHARGTVTVRFGVRASTVMTSSPAVAITTNSSAFAMLPRISNVPRRRSKTYSVPFSCQKTPAWLPVACRRSGVGGGLKTGQLVATRTIEEEPVDVLKGDNFRARGAKTGNPLADHVDGDRMGVCLAVQLQPIVSSRIAAGNDDSIEGVGIVDDEQVVASQAVELELLDACSVKRNRIVRQAVENRIAGNVIESSPAVPR